MKYDEHDLSQLQVLLKQKAPGIYNWINQYDGQTDMQSNSFLTL